MTLQRILLLSFVLVLSVAGRPAMASDSVQVTANNYVRAETDFQMRGYVEKLIHSPKGHSKIIRIGAFFN